MSTTPVPTGADALQATQQQLDELETLIQRMLTVPVHQLDDDDDLPPSEPPRTDAVEHAERLRESTPTVPLPVHEAALPAVDDATMVSIELPPVSAADVSLAARFDFLDTKPVDNGKTEAEIELPPPEPVVREQPPRVASWLWLLIAGNRAFDHSTRFLGTPGRRLRSRRGRSWLGWTGIALLGMALAWALLDWIVRSW